MSVVEKIKQMFGDYEPFITPDPDFTKLRNAVLKILSEQQPKLLVKLRRLTKPRAGSIYSIQQEEGMMLLLTELLVGVKPRSRDEVGGLLHNLKYGFTAKGPRSKTIKKLMGLIELFGLPKKKEKRK